MFNYSPINYIPPVYRPPSEWNSLIIQVTIGCSNNKCTYCDMYRSKKYSVRTFQEIKREIDHCVQAGIDPEKVFLADGDALGASQELLIQVLDYLNISFKNLRRVGIYATAQNILDKSIQELKLLASKKLTIAYLGLESGDDKILHMIVKGNTAEEMTAASLKIKSAGMKLSTIAMLGVGGRALSKQHIEQTAKLLSETNPQFFSFLTTFAVPGTPYFKMVERGNISPLTSKELLEEMYQILDKSSFNLNQVLFRANHVSNANPIGGELPRDKETILRTLKSWIEQTPEGIYPQAPTQM